MLELWTAIASSSSEVRTASDLPCIIHYDTLLLVLQTQISASTTQRQKEFATWFGSIKRVYRWQSAVGTILASQHLKLVRLWYRNVYFRIVLLSHAHDYMYR